MPWPATWRNELTALARHHGIAAAREAEDLLQAQFNARPHEPVVELKLGLLDANRIETASPGYWAISLDGERVLGGPADGPVDAADLVMQRSAQELRDKLVAVGAWPLPLHQGEPRTSDDDS